MTTENGVQHLDPDLPAVCIEHGRFIPCRREVGCYVSQNPYWVKAVRDYQTSTVPGLTWEPASEYARRRIIPPDDGLPEGHENRLRDTFLAAAMENE